jgi:hypothetical protein
MTGTKNERYWSKGRRRGEGKSDTSSIYIEESYIRHEAWNKGKENRRMQEQHK